MGNRKPSSFRRKLPISREEAVQLLDAWLKTNGYTHAEAADIIGATRGSITHWLNGRNLPYAFYDRMVELGIYPAGTSTKPLDAEVEEFEIRRRGVAPGDVHDEIVLTLRAIRKTLRGADEWLKKR